jgi:class 3 adenylate cyclase
MNTESPERDAALLLTDMVGFATKTARMSPVQVRDFLVEYRRSLESLIVKGEDRPQYFEYASGDATAAVFENKESEGDKEKNIRAFRTALRILNLMAENKIPPTRIGLYSGKVIEARSDNQTFRFGNSFSGAHRLQELCGYFGTNLLMDRDIAMAQRDEKAYIAAIGKITPKSLERPIHIFTIYKPGIHKCPHDIDEKKLINYVKLKNEAIDLFCGNRLLEIKPNFPIARKKLYRAAAFFKEITGYNDISTERILEYIRENPLPVGDFFSNGMRIDGKKGNSSLGVRLFRLSQGLLKALDQEFYDTFILDTEWESCFKLEWKKKGEVIIKRGTDPDGVYFLTEGEVHVVDKKEKVIAVMKEGNIFGEMAFFSAERKRSATVIASSDSVIHKITGEDFRKFPALQTLFKRISQNRTKAKSSSRDYKPLGDQQPKLLKKLKAETETLILHERLKMQIDICGF